MLTSGLRDVLPFLAAMWLGEMVWLTVAVTGLAVLAQTFHGLFMLLKIAGVLYLLWLAWQMWTAPAEPGPQAIWVVVRDGHGGSSACRLDVEVI